MIWAETTDILFPFAVGAIAEAPLSVIQTAKHGLEGLEIAGRPAHIEFWTPPGAAYLPLPMVAPPAPPPPPPAGWSSAPMTAAPGSPSAYMGMYPAPSPSYGSYRWLGGRPALGCLCGVLARRGPRQTNLRHLRRWQKPSFPRVEDIRPASVQLM